MPLAPTATVRPPEALPAPWTAFWPLDREYTFLNHGSFGSTPRPTQEAQRRWRDMVEAKPIEMLGRRCRELLAESRRAVCAFVGGGSDPAGVQAFSAGFGFVTNATEGINSVLRSLRFAPGDVLVTTDHVYNAVRQAMIEVARKAGAEVRVVPVPLPLASPDDVLGRVVEGLDARTRLLVIDHITSPTATIFPVQAIAEECRQRGIWCLVDGAHAPGMIDLDVPAIGCTAYAGNLHKWVCAPKGCAFLWAAEAVRASIHPATVSHFLDQGFDVEFDWQGTRDISAWLAVKDAIELWSALGWDRLREHNHALAVWAQSLLCGRWEVEPRTPLDGSMIGSMATVALPEGLSERYAKPELLQAELYDRHRIEVPVVDWGGRWHCRVSCQAYNRPEEYERLADAVLALRDQA